MPEQLINLEQAISELLDKKQFPQLKHVLESMNAADIALILSDLPPEQLLVVFRILPKETAAYVFVDMDPDEQELLISAFSDNELKEVLDQLFIDDTVDIIEEMPAGVVKRILMHSELDARKLINEILNYPKDSAGSIMTPEYVDLKKNMTVAEAFERIRKTGISKETIYTCYVTDESRKILGLVTVKTLLLADSANIIEDIMQTNIIFAETLDDKEDVAKMFDKYDFLALPVVDKEHRLVGIVTVDDAMDVMQEENSEDFAKMSAMAPIEDSYFKTSAFKHARHRIVWLLFLMLSATITGSVLTHYEAAFAAVPLLVSFVPMLTGTGGNCGSQSSTIVIRGLALDEIRFKDFFKVVLKESEIALICGSILAFVNGLRIYLMYDYNITLALIVSLSLIATVLLAKILGCALPMLAKKLHLDPAIMSTPIISTIVDTCSMLIYFNIAVALLGDVIK